MATGNSGSMSESLDGTESWSCRVLFWLFFPFIFPTLVLSGSFSLFPPSDFVIFAMSMLPCGGLIFCPSLIMVHLHANSLP